MRLNTLFDNYGAAKKKMRVGRGIGCGKGKTCGVGVKGQKARCGVAINGFEGGQMPITRRLPKRGFRSLNKQEYHLVNLGVLEAFIEMGKLKADNINSQTMVEAGIIKKLKHPVKLLAKGGASSKMTISIDAISDSARSEVEKVGGSIEIL